jgi:UDP-glucose 4-epimerase
MNRDPALPSLAEHRVLITGGLGFIGSNLAYRCLALGAKVTLYDCLDPRSGGNMFNVSGLRDRVEIVLSDVRNFEGLSAAVLDKTIVFNCAAYTSHPQSMRDPQTDIDVNCRGAINLLEAARRFNREVKLVHVGTSTQVGRLVSRPIDENHPEFPVDIYSANKVASEKYVLIYGRAYGMRTTVVRLANNFGPRSNIRSPEFGFVNYFVGLALQGKPIPVFGDGAQLRNISYVEDSVAALVTAAVAAESDGEVFFAVADRQHSVREIAEAIATALGGEPTPVEWPRERAAIEIGDAVISNRKIKERLGWRPTWDLRKGLVATGEYFSHCLERYL